MTKPKTSRLIASTGVAVALGASLLAATPAGAAPLAHPPAPPVATLATEVSEASGPAYTSRNVTITTSVLDGDEIVVRGVVTYPVRPTTVRGAAGSGYETSAPVAEDGSFTIRIPLHDQPQQDYVLQFGKPFASTFAPFRELDTYWYAERV
ncbi:hypothetical protein [Curtobacterium sp. MCBD17_032]|uniref:hypothetical protein n=1 Tax=Curtobacterium sp. MCBD17_032 TaxID=2175659 RepID=UPI000DA92E2A|nr:hypothetical protein [Curtobacterium sp. MCBD17_032]PZE80654.1 hypothetical protein DEI91_14035 [Curtobacterium sp. MCBD17_032]